MIGVFLNKFLHKRKNSSLADVYSLKVLEMMKSSLHKVFILRISKLWSNFKKLVVEFSTLNLITLVLVFLTFIINFV